MPVNESSLNRLKSEVLERAGINQLTPGHCKKLSMDISRVSGCMISETTVKRVYEFATRHHELSLFTLNALSVFAGYTGWDEHLQNNQRPGLCDNPQQRSQDYLYHHYRERSSCYLRHVLKQARLLTEQLVVCSTMEVKLRAFLRSDHFMTAIAGPVDSGKTMGIAAWSLQYFEKTDIEERPLLLVLNAPQLYSFLNADDTLDQWLKTLFALPGSLSLYQHATLLMIDSFDERSFSREKLKVLYLKLQEACLQSKNGSLLKVVLITRPSVYAMLMQYDKPLMYSLEREKEGVPLGGHYSNGDGINEVHQALLKAGIERKKILQVEDQVVTLMRYPMYLHDFTVAYQQSEARSGMALKWIMDAIARHLAEQMKCSHHPKAKRCIVELLKTKLLTAAPLNADELPGNDIHIHALEELIDGYVIKEERGPDIFRNEWPLAFTSKAVAGFFVSEAADKSSGKAMLHGINVADTADPVLFQWVYRWQFYYFFADLSVIDITALDPFFLSQVFTGKQQMEAFDFIVHLHEPSPEWTVILSKLNDRFNLTDTFFNDRNYLDYLATPKQHFLKVLITVCTDEKRKHDLFSLLFISLLMENNTAKIRELNVVRRLPVVSDEACRERESLMEMLVDIFLYKIVHPYNPQFPHAFFNNALLLLSKNREVDYYIHLLLLHLYLDAGMVLQPDVFSKNREQLISTEAIQRLPYTALLVAGHTLSPRLTGNTFVDQLQVVHNNQAVADEHNISIFRCLQLSLTCVVLQFRKQWKEAEQVKMTLANLASKNGWQWFVSGASVHHTNYSEPREHSTLLQQEKYRSA